MDRYKDEKHNVINKLIFTVIAIGDTKLSQTVKFFCPKLLSVHGKILRICPLREPVLSLP